MTVHRGRRLTPQQERRREEGLRVLARIIARHWLANPHLHQGGSVADGERLDSGGEAVRKEGTP